MRASLEAAQAEAQRATEAKAAADALAGAHLIGFPHVYNGVSLMAFVLGGDRGEGR